MLLQCVEVPNNGEGFDPSTKDEGGVKGLNPIWAVI